MAINQEILNKYNNLNWEQLLRENLGESGNLKEIDPNLQRIKNIFEKIKEYSSTLEQIPNYQRTFENVLSQFVDVCNSEILNNYSDVSQREQKLTRVRQLEETSIGQLSPIFNYLQIVDPVNNTKQEELERKSKEIEMKLRNIDILTEKVKKSVEESGDIAEGQEVKMYGNEFEIMAEGIKREQLNWLTKNIPWLKYKIIGNKQKAEISQTLMLIVLFLTVAVACFFVFGKRIDLQGNNGWLAFWNTMLEQNVLLKIFLISTGGYLVAHFSRNYSAEKNMFYINKHRQLALNSHKRILDAVRQTETNNDSETKNAILLQVTRTMFEMQETGYLKNGNSPVPATQIIETVRSGVRGSNVNSN